MILFTQLGNTFNFSVFWNLLLPREIINNYNITLNPKPENGLDFIFTNDASVTLSLNNRTDYFLTLTVTYCSNLTHTQNHVGKCDSLDFFSNGLSNVCKLQADVHFLLLKMLRHNTIMECKAINIVSLSALMMMKKYILNVDRMEHG